MNHPSNPIYRLTEECSLANFLLPSKSWQVSKNSWSNSHPRSVTYPNAHSMTSQITSNGRIARLFLSGAWFCSGSQSGLEGTVTLFVLLEQELERLLTYDLAGNPDVQFMRLLPVCCFLVAFSRSQSAKDLLYKTQHRSLITPK